MIKKTLDEKGLDHIRERTESLIDEIMSFFEDSEENLKENIKRIAGEIFEVLKAQLKET